MRGELGGVYVVWKKSSRWVEADIISIERTQSMYVQDLLYKRNECKCQHKKGECLFVETQIHRLGDHSNCCWSSCARPERRALFAPQTLLPASSSLFLHLSVTPSPHSSSFLHLSSFSSRLYYFPSLHPLLSTLHLLRASIAQSSEPKWI